MDLICGTFEYGFSSWEDILKDKNLVFQDTSQGKFKANLMTRRLKHLAKCVILHAQRSQGKFEFERVEDTAMTKESSGFSLSEKHLLYEVLINFGIPYSAADESKEDYQLLKILFAKYARGEDADTSVSPERLKVLERFVQSLNTISAKILSDYR